MLRLLAILLCAAPCFAQQVDWISQIRNKPVYDVRQYAFTRKPGGSLVVGANTVVVQPCPLGVAGTDTAHYLYLSGGTGTAEAVLITGGTCATGMSFGTVLFTAAHTHSGAWTVTSASFGLQEAVNAASATGGNVIVPDGNYVLHATVTIAASGVWISGGGIYGTSITRTEDFGDSIYIHDANNVRISGLLMTQTINYAVGPPPTIINRPTSGTHIHFFNTNTCAATDNRLLNMVYGLELDGTGVFYAERNHVISVWDYAFPAVQVGIAGIYLHHSANSAGLPTYVWIRGNIIIGYASAVRNFTLNGHTINSQEAVGMKYGIWVAGCEVCFIEKNSIEFMGYSGILISEVAPHSVADALLSITIDHNYIDFARLSSVEIDNSGTIVSTMQSFNITNNKLLGSQGTVNGIHAVIPAIGGANEFYDGFISDNYIQNNLGSGIVLYGGSAFTMTGNVIAGYNNKNSYPTNSLDCSSPGGAGVCVGDRTGNSAIFLANQVARGSITGNYLCGDIIGSPYDGTATFTVNGISIGLASGYAFPIMTTAPNYDAGCQPPAARSPAVAYDPAFFVPAGVVQYANVSATTVTGCGTLSPVSTLLSGKITATPTGSCAPTLLFGFGTAQNGWDCSMHNLTHPGTTNMVQQNSSNTTSASFTGTTVSGDVLTYSCAAY